MTNRIKRDTVLVKNLVMLKAILNILKLFETTLIKNPNSEFLYLLSRINQLWPPGIDMFI